MIINQFNIYMRSMERFVDELSSNNHVPGGGCVAAVSSVFGQALVLMVANFTKGKEKYKDVQPLVDEVIKLGNYYLKMLKKFSIKDMDAYNDLTWAYRMSKVTEEERAERDRAIRKNTIRALAYPYAVVLFTDKAMDLLYQIYDKFNKNLVSDCGVACKMFEVAATSAYLNVLVNEKAISKNGEMKKTKQVEVMLERIKERADIIYNYTLKSINKK